MREILFRGKTDKGEWVQGVPFFEENRCYIIEDLFICDEYDCTGAVNSMVIPSTVGQYTGLTDRNGTKIFEGDILKTKCGIYVCFWDDCNFEFGIKNNKESFGIAYMPLKDLKVIGNIHDNPELLESEVDTE